MSLKNLVLLFLFLVNNYSSNGQEISCSFVIPNSGYTCDLHIINPDGLNNFTEINGSHLDGFSNNDVRVVEAYYTLRSINVPDIICETFPYVTKIKFVGNIIEYVDESTFSMCKNLLDLELWWNLIAKIDEKAFINNVHLQRLSLEENMLTTLPDKIFVNQQNLETLTITNNKIYDLSENIFDSLVNLTSLRFDRNKIKVIKNQWFKNLKNLYTLGISYNQIEELPKDVFSPLKNLRYFHSFGNRVPALHSDSFGVLPNLFWVDFSDNKMNAIDERFIDNTGIQTLVFYYNVCGSQEVRFDRYLIRTRFRKCFDNYLDLYPEEPSEIDNGAIFNNKTMN